MLSGRATLRGAAEPRLLLTLAVALAACGSGNDWTLEGDSDVSADGDGNADADADADIEADAEETAGGDADADADADASEDAGVDAGPGDPVESYGGCSVGDAEATLLSEVTPPAVMEAGSSAAVEVVFANCGAETWAAVAFDATAGFKLGIYTPRDTDTWGFTRVALPADVPPSHRVRVAFTITAPGINGTYLYQWAVVSEWVRWLEAPSPEHSVEVVGGIDPASYDFHPRTDWQTASEPVSGPGMDLLALRYITLHYNGDTRDLDGPDDVYQDEDYAAFLRELQSGYLASRGYSLGYNSGIAPDGDEWQIRGLDYRSAANGCTEVNIPGYAIQITVPSPDSPPTSDQVAGTRRAVARVREAAAAAGNPHHLSLNGHRDVRPTCGTGGTACPGDIIYGMMLDGEFEP